MTDFKELIPDITGDNDSESDTDNDSDINEDITHVKVNKKKIKKTIKDDADPDDNSDDDDDADPDDDADDNSDDDDDADPDAENTSTNIQSEPLDDDLSINFDDFDNDNSDDDDDENYLQKFDDVNKKNLLNAHHPELICHNNEEIDALSIVHRNNDNVIDDPLHKTLPFITKYEIARVIGERAKQIDSGANIFTEIDDTTIDSYLIALKEFNDKKIPFIIKRPIPNGASEYWKLQDLEILL
jgi:DNA-directed RNA polymerase subunit K/omega